MQNSQSNKIPSNNSDHEDTLTKNFHALGNLPDPNPRSSLTPKSTMPDILESQHSYSNHMLQNIDSFLDLNNEMAETLSLQQDESPKTREISANLSIPNYSLIENQSYISENAREETFLSRVRSNKSASTVGEEYRVSRAEKQNLLRLARQSSEKNVPCTFENEESLDTTKPLLPVASAINNTSRKVSHGTLASGNGFTTGSRKGSVQMVVSQKSSLQNIPGKQTGSATGSQRGSIKSLRRSSYQSLPISVASDSSPIVPEFDFIDDNELISSGFNDTVPVEVFKSKEEISMTSSKNTKGSNLSSEEKKERKRLLIEEQQRIISLKNQTLGKKSRDDIFNEVFSIPLLPFDYSRSIPTHRITASDSEPNVLFRNIVAVRKSPSNLQKVLDELEVERAAAVDTKDKRSELATISIESSVKRQENEDEAEKNFRSPIGIRLSANHRSSIRSSRSDFKQNMSNFEKQTEGSRERPLSFSLYPRKSIVSSHQQTEMGSQHSSLLDDPLINQHRPISMTSVKKSREGFKSRESLIKVLIEAASSSIKRSHGSISIRQLRQEDSKSSPILASSVSIEIPDFKNEVRIETKASSSEKSLLIEPTTDQNGRLSIREQANAEYNQYLLLQQRHDSVNFICQMESADLIYEQQALRIKYLGPHLIGGQIGKGAFGKVKEGICTESLQRVAVKVMAKKRVKKNVDGVIREIKLLRRLKHSNIVTLIDVFAKVEDDEGKLGVFPWFLTIEEEPIVWMFENGEEEERYVKILKWYIVMEFCPCSLQTVLDHTPNHKISLSDAHSYFTQLMHGISYLHSQKVIHRDIKPGNLLLTTDGIIKITDFGIAEIFDIYSNEPMNCTQFAGTHQFLAPEVISDEKDTGYDGTKVDVWACGVVLFNLISGFFPFEFEEEPNILDLHEKIVKGEYMMPSEAVFPLDDLIKKILTVDPVSRFNVEQILAHPWVLSQAPMLTSGILTYHHSNEGLEGNEVTLIPCETTMLPFISQLYQQELELHMNHVGKLSTGIDEEDQFHISQDSMKGAKIRSGIKWLKRHVSLRKSSHHF